MKHALHAIGAIALLATLAACQTNGCPPNTPECKPPVVGPTPPNYPLRPANR